MTFGEYRKENIGWNTKVFATVIDGKNIKKMEFEGHQFEEDDEYEVDDYIVLKESMNYGLNKCIITLQK